MKISCAVSAHCDIRGFDGWASGPAHPKAGPDTSIVVAYDPLCATPIACRRPVSVTDQLLNVTTFTYNAQGQVLTETRAAPTTGAVQPQTRYTYQALHAWFKNSAGTLVQEPTTVSRLIATSACATLASCAGTSDEVVAYTSYQAGSGSVLSNLLPVSTSVGSGDGLLTATTTTTWSADGDAEYVDGPLAGVADTTRTIFDDMRQKIGVIAPDPDGGGARLYPASRTTYNADGQVTSVELGTTMAQTDLAWAAFTSLQTSTTTFDSQGRRVRESSFVGSVNPAITQYSYDAANRLTCTARRMNPAVFASLPGSACTQSTLGSFGPDRITSNTYDQVNQILTVTDGYGTALQRVALTQAWTNNGKLDWLEDAAGNRSNYIYDDFDRLYRIEFPQTTVGTHTPNTADYEQYGYDAANNPTTKRTRSGQTFTTSFDHLNRGVLIDAPSPSLDVGFTYDNLDRRLSAAHVGGSTITMAWDALGRQLSETGPLGAMTYQYDLAGRRTRMTWPDSVYVTYDWDVNGAMTAINLSGSTLITAYSWDNLGRRTGITRGNGASTAYVWNTASQLTSLSQDPTSSTYDLTYGFTYNPVGQVLDRTMSNGVYDFVAPTASSSYVNNGLNQPTTVGGAAVTWNDRGDMTSDGAKSFTYDAANRLTGTTGSALTYDPLDRLYEMTGTGAGRFQYSGNQVATVYPAGSTTVAERYVAGPMPDEWAVIYSGAGTGSPSYPLQNHQGSVIALTNALGAATATLAYDAYGQARAGNTGRFQYMGQMVLPDFVLQNFKARAYHAGFGRFVQTDPAGYAQGLNLYALGNDDPVNSMDPTGLATCSANLSADACALAMAEQAVALVAVRSARAQLANLKAEKAAVAAGTQDALSADAQKVDAALSTSFDSSSNATIARVDAILSKTENFLADHSGHFTYSPGNVSDIILAGGSDTDNVPGYATSGQTTVHLMGLGFGVDTLIHEPPHLSGVNYGINLHSPEIYDAAAIAMAHTQGGTARAFDNADNYLIFVRLVSPF